MDDPYRIDESPAKPEASAGHDRLRPLLWLVLFVSAAANMALATVGSTFGSSVAGLVALLGATALIVLHYRRR